MKLHAFNLQVTVAQAHDDTVGRGRRDFQALRQTLALDHEGMIAPGFEAVIQTFEDRPPVMANFGCFAVYQSGRADDAPAKDLADCLMSQTDAEDGHAPGKLLDDLH